ncbi:GNAT family N-acetyltransferase [Kriegella aquimaris]|uniref:Acetyltransferase (GNAT) family protein n=1 Tax=Kriegella aquimaris TaxID=192904 RepID=A0A1G9K714_9FLAO|nr:GNAT family N-acetyltransferase [Kriegella aquimaris]SDL45155.1 Acetyltransferase (GNAT) family protein [Kriegella aquimaris]
MISIERTTSENPNFQQLVVLLDEYLRITDGDEHAFYNQYNNIENLQEVVVAYSENLAVGCGAIKPYDSDTVEIKRMFVLPEARGQGVATKTLSALEQWARELNYKKCILETGKRQPEAIALYSKTGYEVIPNYGQYQGMENSVCFLKQVEM